MSTRHPLDAFLPAPLANRARRFVCAIAGACCLAFVPSAFAADAIADPAAGSPQADPRSPLRVWVNPGIHSFHFERDLGLRENNYGIGLEAATRDDLSMLAGEYRNSNDRPTRYLAMSWRPLEWGGVRFGVMAAAFNGYPKMHDGGWFAALLPIASLEFDRVGVNFTVVPGYKDQLHGALAVQVKLRIW